MPDQPLAYFITFSTYATWLHGESPGSVDREHNEFGTPWLQPDPQRQSQSRADDAGVIVRDAIVEECRFRGSRLLALHVRCNHVHLVVTADRDPEFVMRCCKSHASKRLNEAGFDSSDRKRWTTHGSTKYLWDEEAVAVDYTLNQQGERMAVYPE